MENKKCNICAGNNVIIINSLKHIWLYCRDCGNAASRRKEKHIFMNLPGFILKKWPSLEKLKNNYEHVRDDSRAWDYMATDNFTDFEMEHKRFEKFEELFIKKFALDITGRKILDISGGNGDFADLLRTKYSAEMTMTEYNKAAVDYAKNKFNIEAVQFDLNKGSLPEIFPRRTFHYILLRAVIQFCLDPSRLARDLKSITAKNSKIIISDSVTPTLWSMMEWQLEDVVVYRLWQPRYIIKAFLDEGYELTAKFDRTHQEEQYIAAYRKNWWNKKMKFVKLLYHLPALFEFPDFGRFEKASNFIFTRS